MSSSLSLMSKDITIKELKRVIFEKYTVKELDREEIRLALVK